MDFYVRKTDLELSQKKKEAYDKYGNLIQWGRKNPVLFAEEVIGIEFLDYQRYCFAESWNKQFSCITMSRNGGKSFYIAPFTFTKMLLFPNFTSYILSVTAQQSQDTFLKMEKMALRQIESMVGLTDFMIQQVQPSVNGNGFIHAPSGFTFKLFNGSSVTTCSGDETNLRGKDYFKKYRIN